MDIDDTLFDSEKAYTESLLKIGVNPQDKPWQDARMSCKNQLPLGHTSARNRWIYFKHYLEARGEFSPRRLIEICDQYENELSLNLASQWEALEREKLFESIFKLRPHLKIIFITNETLRTQTIKLSRLKGSHRIFTNLLCSEELGFEKPDGRLFNFVLQQYQLEAAEGLMVGDDFKKDIQGALNIGMEAILTKEFIGKRGDLEYSSEVYSIEKLNQLLDIF